MCKIFLLLKENLANHLLLKTIAPELVAPGNITLINVQKCVFHTLAMLDGTFDCWKHTSTPRTHTVTR